MQYRAQTVVSFEGFATQEEARRLLNKALLEVIRDHPGVPFAEVGMGPRPDTVLVSIDFDGPEHKYLDDFADELLESAFRMVEQADNQELDLRESMLTRV